MYRGVQSIWVSLSGRVYLRIQGVYLGECMGFCVSGVSEYSGECIWVSRCVSVCLGKCIWVSS